MKRIGLLLVVCIFLAVLTACGVTATNASSQQSTETLKGYTVVLFGDQQFIDNSKATFENLGATVVVASDYVSAQVGIDKPVEVHCLQPGQAQEIVMQANHITNLSEFSCQKGAIFIDFRTVSQPDVVAD